MAERKLTLKQERWARAYIEHGNASRAAREAGYSGSETTLSAMGLENLEKPRLMERVEELKRQQELRSGVDPDRVVNELALMAFSDIADYVSWDGEKVSVKPQTEIPKRLTRAIKKLTVKADGQVIIELHDKVTAIDKLMRHFGMYAADNSSIPPPVINVSTRTENILQLEAMDLSALARLAGVTLPELPEGT